MPRFSVAFSRRKSAAAADELDNAQITTPETSSFRVIERSELSSGKSFDGGIRLARATGNPLPRPNTMVDLSLEDNMFADLKGNRGSGASNSTKATSTDTSSRHSNASTAPSSADFAHSGADDHRPGPKLPLHETGSRAAPKSSPSSFLSRAGRTFSFGGQKKHSVPPPADDEPLPDVPSSYSVPTIQREDVYGRARGMTASTAASTTSTATPPRLEKSNLDLGGDFGSLFTGFDKRASMATLKNDTAAQQPRSLTGNRPAQPAPLKLDHRSTIEPSPNSWNSQTSDDNLLQSATSPPTDERPPPVPPHKMPNVAKPALRKASSDDIEDEDARLLQDSVAATRFLGDPVEEDTISPLMNRSGAPRKFTKEEDNLFTGTTSQFSRTTQPRASQATAPGQNKVMTPAEFERYRKDKEYQERQDSFHRTNGKTTANDDDEDEINYDDDEDEMEKSKQQAKQRRKQEAHMAVYRQQMMKVTGETAPSPPPGAQRPNLPTSLSAPHLNQLKAPSPDNTGVSDEDDDDEVPLAILQAHGFPNRNRPPTRLSTMGSNPNLRASTMPAANVRPNSSMGETSGANRHSTLPAFARNLPQDPFVGASIARPAVRESLALGGGSPAIPQGQPQGPLPPGGLVGVIANEERSRAMRRGSPNTESQMRAMGGGLGLNGAQGPGGFDPMSGIPPHMMYGMNGPGGMGMMPGMPQMPQPNMLTPGDQAQIQMTQQMQQFMQMQMQFMQMMAMNQNGGGGSPVMQQQPFGMPGGNQSVADFGSRNSMLGDPLAEPRRLDPSMRTMSMIQPPSSGSFLPHPGYAGSIRPSSGVPGYTPSIAPSERSNIGLPGRYRPVNQAPAPAPVQHQRSNTMSGALSLSRWDENKSTINVVTKAGDGSDDDEEEGWEAMKAKRDKKKSTWKSKKIFGSDLSTMIN